MSLNFNATGTAASASFGKFVGSSSPQGLSKESANDLGHGVGKMIHAAFSSLGRLWSKVNDYRNQLSEQEISNQRQLDAFSKTLTWSVEQLDLTIENLRKNPNDVHAFDKVKQVSLKYACYWEPHASQKIVDQQKKLFKPLQERVSLFKNVSVQQMLALLLPKIFKVDEIHTKRSFQETNEFPLNFNVSEMPDTEGFAFNTSLPVFIVEDMNEDGLADAVIKKYNSTDIVFQPESGWPSVFNIPVLNGINGFSIQGLLGSADFITSVKNLTGNGLNVLLIADYTASFNNISGVGLVGGLFAQKNWPPELNVTYPVNKTIAFIICGSPNEYLGTALSAYGDTNGDGRPNLLIGAAFALPGGRVYDLFRIETDANGLLNLSLPFDTLGSVIEGAPNDSLGYFVSNAVKLNHDQLFDILIHAPLTRFNNITSGSVLGILGNQTNVGLQLNTSHAAFRIMGDDLKPDIEISCDADMDKDGLTDILIFSTGSRRFTLLYANATLGGGDINLKTSGQNISRIHTTYTACILKDINFDGYADLAFGDPANNFTEFVFGGKDGIESNVSITNNTIGFKAVGQINLGSEIKNVLDLNRDNIPDVMIKSSSRVFIIFSKNVSTIISTPIAASPSLKFSSSPIPLTPSVVPPAINPSPAIASPAVNPSTRPPSSGATSVFAPVPSSKALSPSKSPTLTNPPHLLSPSNERSPLDFSSVEFPEFSPVPSSRLSAINNPSAIPIIPISLGIGAGLAITGVVTAIIVLKKKRKGCFGKKIIAENTDIPVRKSIPLQRVETLTDFPEEGSDSNQETPGYSSATFATTNQSISSKNSTYFGNDKTIIGSNTTVTKSVEKSQTPRSLDATYFSNDQTLLGV